VNERDRSWSQWSRGGPGPEVACNTVGHFSFSFFPKTDLYGQFGGDRTFGAGAFLSAADFATSFPRHAYKAARWGSDFAKTVAPAINTARNAYDFYQRFTESGPYSGRYPGGDRHYYIKPPRYNWRSPQAYKYGARNPYRERGTPFQRRKAWRRRTKYTRRYR